MEGVTQINPSLDETEAYRAVHNLCRGADVPMWTIRRIVPGRYRIEEYNLVMEVDLTYKVKCIGRWEKETVIPLSSDDVELLKSWSLERLIDRTICRMLICDLASKYGLFGGKLAAEQLTRDQVVQIAIRIPHFEIVDILNTLVFKPKKQTVSEFARSNDMNAGKFSQYMLQKTGYTKKIIIVISNFLVRECGLSEIAHRQQLNEVQTMEYVIKSQPEVIMFIDLDNCQDRLATNMWMIDEYKCNMAVVGVARADITISDPLLEQPWFYCLRSKTLSKNAADAAITVLSTTLGTKCDSSIPFIYMSGDHVFEEIAKFLEHLTGRKCCWIDSGAAPVSAFLSKVPIRLSPPAESLKSMISKIQTLDASISKKHQLFLEQLEILRKDFPLIPDISAEAQQLFPLEIVKVVEPIKRVAAPIDAKTGACLGVLRSGSRKGQFCLRESPCDYHSG